MVSMLSFVTGYAVAISILCSASGISARMHKAHHVGIDSRARRRNHQKGSFSSTNKNSNQQPLRKERRRRLKKNGAPAFCHNLEDTEYWTNILHYYDKEKPWVQNCIEYWENMTPSISPSFSQHPSEYLSTGPSSSQSRNPSSEPSKESSSEPSSKLSKEPSSEPSREPPSTPSKSSEPSRVPSEDTQDQDQNPLNPPDRDDPMFTYEVAIPTFELKLLYAEGVTDVEFYEGLALTALFIILSQHYTKMFDTFHNFEPQIIRKRRHLLDATNGISLQFTGSSFFKAKDANLVPGITAIKSETLRAFSGDGVAALIQEVSKPSYSTIQVSTEGQVFKVNNGKGNVTIVETVGAGSAITIAACAVAICSTLGALGLIYVQRRKLNMNNGDQSPTKNAVDSSPTKNGRRLRSPFPIASAQGDGTRKYFCRLDNESVASKSQSKGYLNPDVSCVNSSFSRDEEASLNAPSMSGLSSVCGMSRIGMSSVASVDGDSTAMSAFHDTRLSKVLNLDEAADDLSRTSTLEDSVTKREKRNAFSKLWHGGKNEATEAITPSPKKGAMGKLAPSLKDSPPITKSNTNESPVFFPLQTEDDDVASPMKGQSEEEDADGMSLLEDQSDKGEYYAENDESNLVYNMLGERSLVSYESDSVDFNEMYNGAEGSSFEDGSSTGTSSKMSSN